jgi:hypothetical protein
MFENLNQMIAQGFQPTVDIAGARRNALADFALQQQVESYPEDRAWQQEQRQAARTKMQWLTEDRIKELEQQPIKDDTEKVKYLLSVGPMISFDNYGASRDWLVNRNKIPEHFLPPAQAFMDKGKELGVDPKELFEDWKGKALTSTDQKLREQLGMARLESAEKVAGARIEGADRVSQARLDAYGQRQEDRFRQQQEMEDLRAQHRRELEEAKATGREGKDLQSRQKEARLTVFRMYGLGEFSQYDETVSDKAGAAVALASQMLKQNPEMDPQSAASQAKTRIDTRYKAMGDIKPERKAGWFDKGNKEQTILSVQKSLKGGVDTKDLLEALMDKGWSQQDAITIIRKAAGVE